MGKIIAPMLAASLKTDKDMKSIKYPILCTPKLDGIRAMVIDGKIVSRNLKLIPNDYIRNELVGVPDGLDGELVSVQNLDITGRDGSGKGFCESSSVVMTEKTERDFMYIVFDYLFDDPNEGYEARTNRLASIALPRCARKLLPLKINNETELLDFETKCLEGGYEGVIFRSAHSPYKFDRSSLKEGYLVKLKRFADGEAKIVGFNEQFTAKAGAERTMANTCGALDVVELKTGASFRIGSGLSKEMRQKIWDNKTEYLGKIVKYKSQKVGEKTAPRFPVFIGFRHENDL